VAPTTTRSWATALEKLKLNDAAIGFEKDTSVGNWASVPLRLPGGCCTWRSCRSGLEREIRAFPDPDRPSVRYRIRMHDGSETTIDNPALYPGPHPDRLHPGAFIRATIIVPERYMGAVMKLCLERRGVNRTTSILAATGWR